MFKMETLARCRINARPCARMSSRQSTTTQRSFAREGCGQRAPDSYLCRDRVSACMRLSAPSSNLSTSLSESTATFSHRVRELELRSRKPRRLVTFGAQFRDKVAREDDSGDSQSESSSDEEEDDESELGDDETERGAPFSLSKSAGVRGEYDYGDDEDEEEDDLDDDDLDVIEIDDGELLEVDVSQLGLFGTESRVQAVRWTNEAAASRVAGGETAGEDSKCFAVDLARAASDVKAADLLVLNVAPLVYWTRFFVLATAYSRPQLEKHGRTVINGVGSNQQQANWILLDYGDVVAHIFLPAEREYYNLESFYATADAVELPFVRS
eukprot:jgi/Mesvir1/27705/Mv07414-RA.2